MMPSYEGRQPMQTRVTFQDYSGSVDPLGDESGSETPNGKRSRDLVGVNLPNAELLRLHGAGEMFPERASLDDSDEARGGLVGNYGADFIEKLVDERITDLRPTLCGLLASERMES